MLRRSFARRREFWEFERTPEHRALVLLLYRHLLKGLLQYKSIRRRSMLAYCRMAFRRRAHATEKLLIDECVEEARRSVYVLQKNVNLTTTREYEYDSMGLPKDTKQDVKSFMEDIYDPEMSRQQFANVADVVPGQESKHTSMQTPTGASDRASGLSGVSFRDAKSQKDFKNVIKEEDMVFRPPPPPS